jgi:hypothetical protein
MNIPEIEKGIADETFKVERQPDGTVRILNAAGDLVATADFDEIQGRSP